MTFFGNGLIWNPATNCAYRFENGKYETGDPEKIAFLKSRGLKYEGEEPVAEPKAPAKRSTKKGQA